MITASLLVAALAATPTMQAAPQAPATAPAPVPGGTQAGPGDVWLVIYSVLPDKGPQFEALARQVRDALARSPQEVRQAQARELRIHRSALPAHDGKLMYFLQIAALTGDADRSGFDALIDAVLPEQATTLKKQLASTLDPSNPSGNTYLINVR